VIPEAENFKFKVPLNPSGKNKDAKDSLPQRFETWLKKGENNNKQPCLNTQTPTDAHERDPPQNSA
jgi:hypothetical protein